jgi:hypothetical protein
LPSVSLPHSSTVLRVRQGETKIPLKFCLNDRQNIKPNLNSTVIHFVGLPTCLLLCKQYPTNGRAPNYRSVLLLAGRENIKPGVNVVTTNTVIKVILSTLKYPPHELSALKTSLLLRNAILINYHISSRRNTVHVGGTSSSMATFCYFQIRFISWHCALSHS